MRRLAVVAIAALLAGCTTTTAGHGRPGAQSSPRSSASGGTTPSSPSGAPACPPSYAQPDPKRPRVTLTFDVASDHRTVTGTEHVVFTPDLDVTELVFRLTANTIPTVQVGNKITVTSAKADHGGGAPTYDSAGAAPSTQGGLLHIPFASRVSAGTTVTADLGFTLTLGGPSFDRFGSKDGFAWFASAQPLLAWQVGYGWHTEPMLRFTAESATSEAAQTDLTVTAPGGDTVVASGDPRGTSIAGGRTSWHSTLAAARDVSVSVGPFHVQDSTVAGVALRVASYRAGETAGLTPQFDRAITELGKRFGPFPFPSLSVASLPLPGGGGGGGIEYPGAIQLFGTFQLVDVHETAHQWFYAMVGDSQAQHAWLDEAFASYAEQLVDGDPANPANLKLPGKVDRPTADYGGDERDYYQITYDKGAAALEAARKAAGAGAFDAALRCYVNLNAWRIAVPADLAAALAALPAAVTVLRQAGALS